MTQADKGAVFRDLHTGTGSFVIPNPWDIGSARLLASLGFQALATTGAGFAFSQGLDDYRVGRAVMLEHVAAISAATALPVTADLQNGWGDAPEAVAQTVRMAAAAGAVGCSIEDISLRPEDPLYPIGFAAERIRAAAQAAHALPFPFTLTARAENFLLGRPDLPDTIARLQAYQDAGADVLYAPGLSRPEDIAAVIAAIDRPLNVVIGLGGIRLDVAELSALGVKRISTGSALARSALGAFLRAAQEIREQGTFRLIEQGVPYKEIRSQLAEQAPASTGSSRQKPVKTGRP